VLFEAFFKQSGLFFGEPEWRDERGTRESAREREREREMRNGGAAHGARSRGGCNGRRWSKVAGGCGGSGCSGERERARERESEGKELQRRRRGEEEGFTKFKP